MSFLQIRHFRRAPALTALLVVSACGGGSGQVALAQLSAATPASFSGACADLSAKLGGLASTVITASTSIPAGSLSVAGQAVPEHCLVTGRMFERVSAVDGQAYAIGFEMRLPTQWNGRFFYQANGGSDGVVVTATGAFGGGPATHALLQKFAVLSSDAGHRVVLNPSFGIDPQARLDYGYQAVGKLTPMAKSLIQVAYGKTPDRSYIGGCSNGGRHAMVAAARYAEQYDGILAGAPGYKLPLSAIANFAGGRLYASVATDPANLETGFTLAERKLVASSVLAKCDALDGASDGLVQDVTACQAVFNLERDVPSCSGPRDGTCLSPAQKTVIGKIFSGPTTSSGALIYASFPFDAGVSGSGIPMWEFSAPSGLNAGSIGMIFKVPPENPAGFSGAAFFQSADIDTLVAQVNATTSLYTESGMGFMAPPNPTNLSTLKNRGAKILVYHGVSDPIFSVNDSEAWYKGLQAANGGDASNFARLLRVPGMGHCSGGPATDQFDAITPLVNWVEQGQAPGHVIATARGAGNAGGANADVPATWAAGRTRPICAYPKVARYVGSGSLEEAGNFRCE
ncbi:MAG TPA: tannase/feruloyl esterase family alpha/beta hydrolase [Burkholderiaceae bacterium]|nr:tannase/feruloyl esterase family alpha/beta hydrolase [Burkholderiaceae bacterium]